MATNYSDDDDQLINMANNIENLSNIEILNVAKKKYGAKWQLEQIEQNYLF